ncbi:hypothetical protein AVEN_106967-1 [Araneus ventricosus]|uniref:Uncharacterized protein n=1 Tax=Araneus ventricosus TaxID=182803 RepID=A0A4Y2Q5U3_ARAVE|nr:hypothetical protein AVEN_106967-1 [Araneus ventricosus]
MNTGNDSIKTLLSSRGDFQGSGMRTCWQNTAGHWYEKLLLHGTRGRQTSDEATVFLIRYERRLIDECDVSISIDTLATDVLLLCLVAMLVLCPVAVGSLYRRGNGKPALRNVHTLQSCREGLRSPNMKWHSTVTTCLGNGNPHATIPRMKLPTTQPPTD